MPSTPDAGATGRVIADWAAPSGVQAFFTTRALGDMKDATGRTALGALLPAPPIWLRQVHGTQVVDVAAIAPGTLPEADAAFTTARGTVCAIMTADCLPVVLAASDGSVVGAAHAGWRGLCAGVIERTVAAMQVPGASLQAWLGPAIGPRVYEVGAEVRDAFVAKDARAAAAFVPTRPGHWLLDLYAVARQRLADCGVDRVDGGTHCTASEPELFYSFRRNQAPQRMAAVVWRV